MKMADPRPSTGQLWSGMRQIGLDVARLRHATPYIGQPFTVESVQTAQQRDDPELRDAVDTLRATVIRIGSSLDELLLSASRRRGRAHAASELSDVWRWARAQDHGVPVHRVAHLETAAKTARRLARFADPSAAALHRAAVTFDQDMPNALRLIEAAWSGSPGPNGPIPWNQQAGGSTGSR